MGNDDDLAIKIAFDKYKKMPKAEPETAASMYLDAYLQIVEELQKTLCIFQNPACVGKT